MDMPPIELANGMLIRPGYYYQAGRYAGEHVQNLAQQLGHNDTTDVFPSPFYKGKWQKAEEYINAQLPCNFWAGTAPEKKAWGIWYIGESNCDMQYSAAYNTD